jgi:hypothetical protein
MICIDGRHAKAVLQMQINKIDRNDAIGIARIKRHELLVAHRKITKPRQDEVALEALSGLIRLDWSVAVVTWGG